MKRREGLLIGSGCDCGELYLAIRGGKSDEKLTEIASFYDYLEVVPTGNFEYYIKDNYAQNMDELIKINKKIIEIAEKTEKLVVAVSDAHYVHTDDAICRKIIMHHKGYKDFDNQPNLSMRTTDEMLKEFDYLGREKAYEIVVENTNKIADMVDDLFLPIDTEVDYEADVSNLVELTYEKLHGRYGDNIPQECLNRVELELSIIGQNQRNIYNILLSSKLVGRAMEKGWTVGNRGSVASSYIAFLLGITEVNPLDAHYYCPNCHYVEFHSEYKCGADMDDKICECGTKLMKDGFTIPYETFFGTDASRDIDIDLNFPPEYQGEAINHLKKIAGGEVVRCGTIGTFSDKTACGIINKYCEEQGVDFPKYGKDILADKISRVKRNTGQHPGGVFVIPKGKEICDYTPIQHPADMPYSEIITTHFDYHSLPNLLKVDVLAHDVHGMIKQLEELTNLKSKDILLDDAETFELFNSSKTAGIPEFSSVYVRKYVMPSMGKFTFDKLIRVSGLSHGTGVWIDNGEVLLKEGKDVSEIVSCRDDVMISMMSKGIERKYAFKVSERIRKGIGLTPEQYDFLLEKDIEKWRLDSWNKIKYSFPRAHAASYVLYAYKIAYYKAHYPLEFYCAYFNMNKDWFDADLLINNSAQLSDKIERYSIDCKNSYLLDMMEVGQEMYDTGYRFVSEKIKNEKFESFFIEDGKIRPKLK